MWEQLDTHSSNGVCAGLACIRFRARRANPALHTNEGMPNPSKIGRLKQEYANPFTCLSGAGQAPAAAAGAAAERRRPAPNLRRWAYLLPVGCVVSTGCSAGRMLHGQHRWPASLHPMTILNAWPLPSRSVHAAGNAAPVCQLCAAAERAGTAALRRGSAAPCECGGKSLSVGLLGCIAPMPTLLLTCGMLKARSNSHPALTHLRMVHPVPGQAGQGSQLQ